MARIYVSSTSSDLKDYRARVSLVLRQMGHEDVAMEYYVAEDQRPVDRCLADVAACDVYLGIFAWRYGWVPLEDNSESLSITELEYKQAQDTKPCLIFLLSEDAPWPPALMDRPSEQIDRLRRHLAERHGSGPRFHSVHELGSLVTQAIYAWEKSQGGMLPQRLIPKIDLTVYFAELRKRYQRLDLDVLTPPQKEEHLQIQLRAAFVEPSVRADAPPLELPKDLWERLLREQNVPSEELPAGLDLRDIERARQVYFSKPVRPALEVLRDTAIPHMVILGDPGAGKSTLLRYILLSMLDPSRDKELGEALQGALPILVELRTYATLHLEGRCEGFLDFLDYIGQSEGWELPVRALTEYLASGGRAIVLFDGLDEIFDPDLRERVMRRIAGFAAAYAGVRSLVTSRVIGYRRAILADAGFAHFTLQDLDDDQVFSFVRGWYQLALAGRADEAASRIARIGRAFVESPAVRQLAGNPMLLTIIAIMGKHQELPRERWRLYDHAASVLMEHWDINKHLRAEDVEAEIITESDKKHLLRELAYSMQAGRAGLAGNYIHLEALQEVLENYLARRFYPNAPDRSALIARRIISQLRERNFILVRQGPELYGFVHRAFLEYFCASAFVHRFEKTQTLSLEQLKQDVYGRHWEDRSWHEVLRLACQMIDPGFAGEIIAYLTSGVYQPWPYCFGDFPPWNIVLAVQCLGEVSDLSMLKGSADALLLSCCRLFARVINGREHSLASFLDDSLCPAVVSVGSNWPGRQRLAEWLTTSLLPSVRTVNDYSTQHGCGVFIGALSVGDGEVQALLQGLLRRGNTGLQCLAVHAFSVWGPDLGVTLLREALLASESPTVRRLAIGYLVQQFALHPRALLIAEESAVLDESGYVRSAALEFLAVTCPDSSRSLVFERAVKDEDGNVRCAVMRVLGAAYRNDLEGVSLLRERALKDEDIWVRCASLETLAEKHEDFSETFMLLKDRAVDDPDDFVRTTALGLLAEKFRKEPAVEALLRERAETDGDLWVRRAAGKLAARLSSRA